MPPCGDRPPALALPPPPRPRLHASGHGRGQGLSILFQGAGLRPALLMEWAGTYDWRGDDGLEDQAEAAVEGRGRGSSRRAKAPGGGRSRGGGAGGRALGVRDGHVCGRVMGSGACAARAAQAEGNSRRGGGVAVVSMARPGGTGPSRRSLPSRAAGGGDEHRTAMVPLGPSPRGRSGRPPTSVWAAARRHVWPPTPRRADGNLLLAPSAIQLGRGTTEGRSAACRLAGQRCGSLHLIWQVFGSGVVGVR